MSQTDHSAELRTLERRVADLERAANRRPSDWHARLYAPCAGVTSAWSTAVPS